jgi:hypothetical protein
MTKLTIYGEPKDFDWGARIAAAYLSRHGDENRQTTRKSVLYVDQNDQRTTSVWGDRRHVRVRIEDRVADDLAGGRDV